jgi:hypothetical protein
MPSPFLALFEINRSSWPAGPWDQELDSAEGTAHGLPWAIQRNYIGALCGYVGVPDSHPLFGKDFNFLLSTINQPEPQPLDCLLSCHGGITYASKSAVNGYWWFGFDCAHAFDITPLDNNNAIGEYRDMQYVKAECEKLANKLAVLPQVLLPKVPATAIPLWAIRHKPSGHFLPEAKTRSGRGGSLVEPTPGVLPRTFPTKRGAQIALGSWLRGKWICRRGQDIFTGEYYEETTILPQLNRKKEEMEIVPLWLTDKEPTQ